MSEDEFVSGLVHAGLEAEVAAFFRRIEGPSGEDFGHFGDVFLRVAAVYAERVQFHQFAAVVFVEAAGLLAFATPISGSIAALVWWDAERDFRVRAYAQP